MSEQARQRLFKALDSLVLIDPHSHINPHAAASTTLADILGYHYYTELAHSSGMPREEIEEQGLEPREKVRRLAGYLDRIDNTVQLSWLFEMCRALFDHEIDHFSTDNWEEVFTAAEKALTRTGWEDEVLERSRVEQIFLTNDFDDPLEGFDTRRYVPCLRTDDLVFKFHDQAIRERLARATGVEVSSAVTFREAVGELFEHFTTKGARACAISLPPDFAPQPSPSESGVEKTVADLLAGGDTSPKAFSNFAFWTLAEFCDQFELPFDLMIGVNRQVYPTGVFQGQDLYDSRTSLIQYAPLFNAFPRVTFPVSVLAETSNQELVSYAWIFPNVVTNGHWWYSNIPSHIKNDLRARVQAVPRTKQVGYYSDAYKLEFIQPKFAMYKRVLADVLFEEFILAQHWSEERAVALGQDILRGNVERIFRM